MPLIMHLCFRYSQEKLRIELAPFMLADNISGPFKDVVFGIQASKSSIVHLKTVPLGMAPHWYVTIP